MNKPYEPGWIWKCAIARCGAEAVALGLPFERGEEMGQALFLFYSGKISRTQMTAKRLRALIALNPRTRAALQKEVGSAFTRNYEIASPEDQAVLKRIEAIKKL